MNEYQKLLAEIDICEARDAGKNAALERFGVFAESAAKKVKARLLLADAGVGDFKPYELLFAANARCVCGAGLAYPEDIGMHGSWYCSAILIGQAQAGTEHSPSYPFSFYKIKREGAERGSTRPPGTHVEREIHWACKKCQAHGLTQRFRDNQRKQQESLVCSGCGERYINKDGSSNSNISTRYFDVVVDG